MNPKERPAPYIEGDGQVAELMEILKPTKDSSAPSIEELDSKIIEILDPQVTKEGFKEYWRDPRFAELFPNLTYRLLMRSGHDSFTEEQRRRIFELGLTSFMEMPQTVKEDGAAVSGKMSRVNEKTQLWERVKVYEITPGTEPLARLEIGSLMLLGFSLQDRQHAKNLIQESYRAIFSPNKTPNSKATTFTDNLITLATKNNAFRQWVKTNSIDTQNRFNWDRDPTKLAIHLIMSSRRPGLALPKQFVSSLNSYPPEVIDELLDSSLVFFQTLPRVNADRKDLSSLNTELLEVLKTDFCQDPSLLAQIQSKQQQLAAILASAVEKR